MAMQILWKKGVLLSCSMAVVLPAAWQHCLCSPILLKSTQINCCLVEKRKKNMTRSVVEPLDTRCDIPSCHWSICIDMGTSSPATENKASLSVKFTSSVTEVWRDDQSWLRLLRNRMMRAGAWTNQWPCCLAGMVCLLAHSCCWVQSPVCEGSKLIWPKCYVWNQPRM